MPVVVNHHWVRENDYKSVSATANSTVPHLTSARPELWRSRLVMISLWTWCALLSFPLITVDAFEATTNEVLIYQGIGLLLFVIVTMTVIPVRVADALNRYTPFQATIVLVILLSLTLQFHGPEASILAGIGYTLALFIVILCLSAVWTMRPDALATCLGGISVVLLAFGVCAIAVLGWPEARRVGGIHPNALGGIMLAGFVASQFCGGFVMLGLRVACLDSGRCGELTLRRDRMPSCIFGVRDAVEAFQIEACPLGAGRGYLSAPVSPLAHGCVRP